MDGQADIESSFITFTRRSRPKKYWKSVHICQSSDEIPRSMFFDSQYNTWPTTMAQTTNA